VKACFGLRVYLNAPLKTVWPKVMQLMNEEQLTRYLLNKMTDDEFAVERQLLPLFRKQGIISAANTLIDSQGFSLKEISRQII
jgi:hypothetical protein